MYLPFTYCCSSHQASNGYISTVSQDHSSSTCLYIPSYGVRHRRLLAFHRTISSPCLRIYP
ncbi:hypothetical protein ASPTUDRAFT_692815 [Aspergillus tubingensis CBS 134.48]|uniref:Uncharacterized protein n=1 Tax=Aspergillus tubingensis (strain CBS 134.48) TaxID=767770 RepID=A0A1L9N0J6_ASPTC|nr:hypothetical protein ASPTUDRAFT_692815 [Aspergillus tubingensis CBS 134.48]